MRITFLGTSADTAYPLPFCLCSNCSRARELGGKNLRRRSSVVINKDLIIDLGPDVMSSSFMGEISIANIKYWLQTHPHSDHFDASHLQTRIPEYAGINYQLLELYASKSSISKMSEMIKANGCVEGILEQEDQKKLNLKVNVVSPPKAEIVGSYEVKAFSANHDDSVESLLYSIKEGDKTVFYATDTNEFPEETWIALQKENLVFNVVMLDHTYGPNIKGGGSS